MPGLAWAPPTGAPEHVSPRRLAPRLDPRFCTERHHCTRNTLDIHLSPTIARRLRRRNQSPPLPRRMSHAPDRVRHRPAAPRPPGEPPGHAEQLRVLALPLRNPKRRCHARPNRAPRHLVAPIKGALPRAQPPPLLSLVLLDHLHLNIVHRSRPIRRRSTAEPPQTKTKLGATPGDAAGTTVSYTHLTLPTNREV